jgi:hypothetical protein
MFEDWVIDVTNYKDGGLVCFVPVRDLDSQTRKPKFITGLHILTSLEAFDRGRLRGFMHEYGQEACDKWCEEHKPFVEQVFKRAEDILVGPKK